MHARKLVLTSALTVLASGFGTAALCGAQFDHVYNPTYVVKAYELTPEQEASFNAVDSVASPFWLIWDEKGEGASRAIIDSSNCAWGRPLMSWDTLQLELRVAYGDSGVYACFLSRWGGDYELYSNKFPATELYGDSSAKYLPCMDTTEWQKYMYQISYWYLKTGATLAYGIAPSTISLDYWDPALRDYTVYGCWPGNVVRHDRSVLRSEAKSKYGIQVGINLNSKECPGQEWLIPWRSWGGFIGVPITKRVSGDRLAMCFGLILNYYNTKAIYWRNANPYMNTVEANLTNSSIPKVSYDAWGDILFAERLNDVVGAKPQVARSGRGTSHAVQIRLTGTALFIESPTPLLPGRIFVTDARGKVVAKQEASSRTTIPWPAGLRGVFGVRVGEKSVGSFVAR